MNNNQMQMNISLKDTTKISCEACGSEVFTEGLMLRKVSRFLTGTEKDAIVPVPVFFCSKCHHINSEFMPKDQEPEAASSAPKGGMNVIK